MSQAGITLIRLAIEGYGSIQTPVQFELNRGGITLVRGGMGDGKTTLFSSLFWVLYGLNLKGTANDRVATWEPLRGEKFRGTRVVLILDKGEDEYLIARHLNYTGTTNGLKGGSKLLVFKNGELLADQYKKDSQLGVNALLGMDGRAFLNSVVFGQRMQRLVEADNGEKRALFDSLFELDFIKLAAGRASAEMLQLNSTLQALTGQRNTAQSKYDAALARREEARRVDAEFSNQQADALIDLDDRLAALADDQRLTGEALAYHNTQKPDQDVAKLEAARQRREAAKQAWEQAEANVGNANRELRKVTSDLQEAQWQADNERWQQAREALADKQEALTAHNRYVVGLRQEYGESERKAAKLQQDLADIVDECPTCLQPLAADKVEAARAALRKQLTAEGKVQKELTKKINEATQKAGESSAILEEAKTWADQLKAVLDKPYQPVGADYDNAKQAAATAQALQNETAIAWQSASQAVETLERSAFDLRKWETEERTITDRVNRLETERSGLQERRNAEAARKPPVYDWQALDTALNSAADADQELADQQVELETRYGRLEWWNKKAFGASGLRAFVFSAMLNQLNACAAKYAERLGFAVKFSVDTTKASRPFTTIVLRGDGLQVDYAELSGGEKQSVDICLAFAMHELLSAKVPINVLILDEVFEGLDREQTEAVYDLIRLKAGSRSVYVITHTELADSMGTKTVVVRKEDNQSYFMG